MVQQKPDIAYLYDDDALTKIFLDVAKEMGRRGRKVWEQFYEELANDDSADADEVRGWLAEYRVDEED